MGLLALLWACAPVGDDPAKGGAGTENVEDGDRKSVV